MRGRRLALKLLAVAFMVCARAQAAGGGEIVNGSLEIGDRDFSVDWFLPSGEARALVTLQHGFSRNCSHVRGTGRRIMDRGLMVLCVDASMAGGNPKLAESLAVKLNSGITAPDGRPLPDRIIVAGHSAGGHFASRLGWKLAAIAPQRLAGAVLFDPVAASGFTANLMAISVVGQRPVLAISANPASCNAWSNAYPALRQVRQDAIGAGSDGFVGLQLIDHSTHLDVEGSDTDLLGIAACAQGPPRRFNVESLRTLAAQWAHDMAADVRTAAFYAGGSFVSELILAADAELIE